MTDEGKVDANDVAAELGPEGLAAETDRLVGEAMSKKLAAFPTIADLRRAHGDNLRPAVVQGILRQGEVMNLVAPSKAGKTWLGYHLACAVAAGIPFLGYTEWQCAPGIVVIIDNELHPETIAYRFPLVRKALGLPEEIESRVRVISLRGATVDVKDEKGKSHQRMYNIRNMHGLMAEIKALRPSLVLMDALYRFLPEGCSENDNSAMTEVYNHLDRYASWIRTAGIVVVHHMSKGDQGDKDVMSLGAGAGSIGRACDNHFAIRELDEPQAYAIECKPRTWPTPPAVAVKWNFPLWEACDADPSKVRGRKVVRACEEAVMPHGDDAVLLSLLTEHWQAEKSLEAMIRQQNKYTGRQSAKFIEDIKSKHNLYTLHREDGVKVCGEFEAQREAALLFRRKSR
jgi:hypothetical protein